MELTYWAMDANGQPAGNPATVNSRTFTVAAKKCRISWERCFQAAPGLSLVCPRQARHTSASVIRRFVT
ncbi:MAG: hypothetical protein M3X11_07210 [Acidobacteriota bacterium]|nr:hypothetical protein [Acidobacteriota bacterium]